MPEHRKLIEIAMPLEAISRESTKEKGNPFLRGHPRNIHIWWSRKPLAACRGIIFASIVDDPSVYIQDESLARQHRKRLFDLMERLSKWENRMDADLIAAAQAEMAKSIASSKSIVGPELKNAKEVRRFLAEHGPTILDPFCGAGSIPLEAQRLGLKSFASDLNPVAVLITKALAEIPARFHSKPPVNPDARIRLSNSEWKGTKGIAEDVRFYGEWIAREASKALRELYPRITLPEICGGGEGVVDTWIWARTVRCPNPACNAIAPLTSKFTLSTKGKNTAWIEPQISKKGIEFTIRPGQGTAPAGTVNRKGATCLTCGSPIPLDFIRSEGKEGRLGRVLMAIVAETEKGKEYLPPSTDPIPKVHNVVAKDSPDTSMPDKALGFRVQAYGMTKHSDLYTQRQLVALGVFCGLVNKARAQILSDAQANGSDKTAGGNRAYLSDYADAITTYLALAVDKLADYNNALCTWNQTNTNIRNLFSKQAVQMTWDFAEANPIEGGMAFDNITDGLGELIEGLPTGVSCVCRQLDAAGDLPFSNDALAVTDPPYYDNIGYADLSDILYVWLRRCVKTIYPDLFSTILVPKDMELVATPHRFGGNSEKSRTFFEDGLEKAFVQLRKAQNVDYPLCIYYAFKQMELESGTEDDDGTGGEMGSTGWEAMLEALLKSGFRVMGTWPIRTERAQRSVALGTNALASSIILVCRQRAESAPMATRREFTSVLRTELPQALKRLEDGNIAPVDLAQATIGPGIAIFSRYSKVLEADGSQMTVHTALQIINQELESFLKQEEGEMDADTQFCITWFEQYGMNPGPFGQAEVLTKAKNTSVDGLSRAQVLTSKGGKVCLTPRTEYPTNWNPAHDTRLTLWECTQHLIKKYQEGGEAAAAELVSLLGIGKSEDAKNLAYRLYLICDRKGWAEEARAYNELVAAWSETQKKAARITGEGPQRILDVSGERKRK